jgi:SAM-dependent methyltransferase
MARNLWLDKIEQNPGHSQWYIERFRAMAADGVDLHGEARFIDAMVPRGARVLDAGCGPGRVGGRLGELGHDVVGVDIDPALIAAAEQDHPGPNWLVGDLSELDLAALGVEPGFDAVICAGNVMGFLDPATRRRVIEQLSTTIGAEGRIVIGFGAAHGYPYDEFFADVDAVGLVVELALGTWDLRPFTTESDFLVAVLAPNARRT